jgi:predicted nucleic acid-binding protein
MEAVLDTNVLVSGHLRSDGPPGEIVDLIFRGLIIPAFDDRNLYEYRDVLRHPKFLFNPHADSVITKCARYTNTMQFAKNRHKSNSIF